MSAALVLNAEVSQALQTPRITPQDFDPPEPAVQETPQDAAPAATDADAPPQRKSRRRNCLRDQGGRVAGMQRLLPKRVPRLRDIQIYESVVFEKMSQYDVASVFGLSQPRICQIVQEVRAWKATVPWEVAGMTDQQQINLATHETRQWLAVIRDKALERDRAIEGEFRRLAFDKNGQQVRSESGGRTIAPKPGFLAIALQAVLKAGQLGGAGEQWKRRGPRDETAVAEVESRSIADCRLRIADSGSSQSTVLSEAQPPNADAVGPSGADPQLETLNRELGTLNSAPARLLKPNRPEFSVANGKANGHATSALGRSAQIEELLRRKNRRIAYHAAADRQGVSPQSRSNFFAMLRQLEQAAHRVERMVESQMRREARQGAQPTGEELQHRIESSRRHLLQRQLELDRRLHIHPYGPEWVWQQYDLRHGRFRWQE